MIIGKFPVVKALLAQFLGSNNLWNSAAQRVDDVAFLAGGHFQPLGHVAALQALCCLAVDGVGKSLTGESVFRHVAAPGNGIALIDSIVDHLHHLVHRQVVTQWEAPVVLYLYCKGCIEGVVCEAGDVHIVVEVDAEAGSKTLRGVFLALVGELFRTLAEIGIENALHTSLPSIADFLGIAFGNSCHIRLQHAKELVEVVE